MNKKQEFIGEIRQHLSDAGGKKPRHFKRTRTLSKTLSIPGVLIISSILVLGALVGFIWQSYTLQIEGNINVTGSIEEAISLYYDDVQLTGTEMTITEMDYDVLNPGDDYTVSHTFESTGNRAFDIEVDLQFPDNSDPESLWYGFDIWVLEAGTDVNLTDFTVMPSSVYTFDIRYRVHTLFEEPVVDFPFSLVFNIILANLPPTANGFSVTIPYAATAYYNVIVLSGATDPEGDPVTVKAIQQDSPLITAAVVNSTHISLYSGSGSPFYNTPVWCDLEDTAGNTVRITILVSKN